MKRNRTQSGRNGNNANNPPPFAVGMKIRPIAHFGRHSYQQGKTYTVVSVDTNDSTLRASDGTGDEGNWIRWSDCQLAEEIGWDWLKQMLPAEALDLLSNFDGLENLRLNEDVRTQLLLGIPDLKNRILEVREKMENESLNKVTSADAEDDEDDDPFANFL